ncbi:MAG: prsK [Alphaproteobacteria bacterium]|nr:prsK [Alphaproteobacteria bacterium]
MFVVISLWSDAIAAVLYGALALWQLRRWSDDPRNRVLVVAFAVTSMWGSVAAFLGPQHTLPLLLAIAQTFFFLNFMYGILRSAEEDDRVRAVKVVYFAVAAVLGLQLTTTGLLPQFADVHSVHEALISTSHMLGLTVAAGCLVLVHNVYAQAAPESRWGIRLPMIALAGMWIYDLHLNMLGYLSGEPVDDLYAMRGAILAMLVPAFALASRRNAQWRIRLSRAATFQSMSLLGLLFYLLVMTSAARAFEIVGGHWVRIGQIGLVFATTMAAILILPSGKARAWLRVMLAKHFFEHRYDYREEWLRFTRTMGVAGENAAPIEDRVVKAIADIADSPAGLLLAVDPNHRFSPAASWNWPQPYERCTGGEEALARFLETSAHVLEFDRVRGGGTTVAGHLLNVPDWMIADGLAWAGVPLIHHERLIGVVLLAHPLLRRPLDWEDYDLFRTAGRQAASYLAEARSHHALADAQRFDEFNRRFAFIMHDIKNLVSQLSLVARNAERHAENPEFRADMIATLQSSVKKMNDLLARLSRGNGAEGQPARPIALEPLVASIADLKRRVHPIALSAESGVAALADGGRLEQALTHLVQNAIDASPAGIPVRIGIALRDQEAVIEIADRGSGMSAEFIRTRLFQPFASTKEGGFGIGAFEARALILAMAGRIEVDSREHEGTCFTIFLPAAQTAAGQHERMSA